MLWHLCPIQQNSAAIGAFITSSGKLTEEAWLFPEKSRILPAGLPGGDAGRDKEMPE